MLLLTNFSGSTVATPPHLYSEKSEVSQMLKEHGPVEDVGGSVSF